MGRLELDFGGIDCEYGGSARLLPPLLKRITTFFSNLVGLMFFSSHQQYSVEKCETVFKDSIENLPL